MEGERLYGLPLDEFVRERDALARRLRKEGRRTDADEVAKLAKPPVPAWAVNQLARRRSAEVARLLDTADALRRAQTGGGGDFAQAAADEREAVRALVDAAAEILRESGRPPTDATLSRVGKTLQAAAADEQARGDLERGVLADELEPSGFGGLFGSLPPAAAAPKPRPTPKRDRAREKEAVARARARAKELRQAAATAERKVADARRALERAEREAAQARERAERAQRDVETAER